MMAISIVLVSADHIVNFSSGADSVTINEDITNLINISVNNTLDLQNITTVNVSFWNNFVFLAASNGTDSLWESFANISSVIGWFNSTSLVKNGTKNYFWFNATASTPGTYNISVTTIRLNGTSSMKNLSITVNDTTPPNLINITEPTPAANSNLSQNFIRVNISASDNNNVSVIRVFLYFSNGTLKNNTNISSSNAFLNFTGLFDAIYHINATANDSNGNQNLTSETRVIRLDTIGPVINYVSPTPGNNSIINYAIPVNVTATDNGNVSSIRIFLYYSNGTLINNTNVSSSNAFLNFTGLTGGVYHVNFTANDSIGNQNLTSGTRVFTLASQTFLFNGTMRDENGNYLNNTNITMTIRNQEGWSVATTVSTTSNASGWFNFEIPLNGVSQQTYMQWLYEPSMLHTFSNSTLTFVDFKSKALPAFPFMMVQMLAGTTFYLTPAGTINLTAMNSSGHYVPFQYQIKDTKLGYPIAEDHVNSVSTITVYVPRNRNYTIMIYPNQNMPVSFVWNNFSRTDSYAFGTNNISSYNATTYTLVKQFNLTMTHARVTGYVNATGYIPVWTNLTIIPYLLEGGNMVHAEFGDMPYNLSTINGTSDSYNFGTGFYNITLPATVETSNILLFAAAENGSNIFGGFKNISLSYPTTSVQFNFTNMTGLLGISANISLDRIDGNGNSINISTKKLNFNIINTTNGSLQSTYAHVEATVDYSAYGATEFTWMVDAQQSQATANFDILLLNTTGIKEMNVFASGGPNDQGDSTPDQYAPKRISFTIAQLVANNTNITIRTFNPDGIDASLSAGQISIGMYISNSTCDVPNPASPCTLGSSTQTMSNFNPMQAVMGGGKISFRMGVGNITVHYSNVDMLASGPPDALFDSATTNTTSATSFDAAVRFGSQGPTIYDYVLVSMPYIEGSSSISGLNESLGVNMSIPNIYDDNWNVIWNASRNGTNATALAGNYTHYSTYSSQWQTLMTSTNCTNNASVINSTIPCYIDTTNNKIWIRLPHFSGTGPRISGTSVVALSSSSSSSSGGGGGGSGTSFWVNTQSVTEKQFTEGYTQSLAKKYRAQVSIDKKFHYIGVVDLTSATATINVSSKSFQAVFNIGDEKKFDVTEDGYYDIYVKLNSITNNKASVTIKKINEKIPASATTPATTPAAESEPIPTAPTIPSEELEEIKSSNALFWVIGIIIVIVILVAIVYLMTKTKTKKIYGKIKVFY